MLSDSIFVKQPPKGDEEEVFSPDETALLINYFNEHPSVVHFGLHLMLLSGLRIGELCALRRNCINLKWVSLEVMASEIQYDDKDGHRVFEVEETPKTDESRRTVYLPDSAATLLRKIQRMSPFGEWLFSYEDGRRVKSRAFNRALEVACEKVGIPVRSSHKIRKTYASTLIDAGVSTKLIQKQMGHKDFQTTKKYYDRDRTGEDYKRNEINRAVSL
jgi:integrase